MQSRTKPPILKRFDVSHPEYGETEVDAIDKNSATEEAAKKWGANWAKIAGYCRVSPQKPRPRCKRCGHACGKAGDPDGLCPVCQQAAEYARHERAQVKTPDRRPGYRT